MIKKVILYSLAGVLSFVILVLILFPFVAPSVLAKNSKNWIGRSISLDKMRLNYFTGTIKLYEFNLYEKDDSTIFVSFDTLIIDTEPYRLFGKTLVIEQFYLKGLFVDVIMYDSAFNFDDLVEVGSDSSEVSKEENIPETDPLKFEFSNMELQDAKFIIQDAEIRDSIEIKNFDFFLPHLVWNQNDNSEADLRFDFKNEGYFESLVDYYPGTGSFKIDFILGNYDISGYQKFVAKYVDIGRFNGVVDLHVNMEGNIECPIQTTLSSKFTLSDFALYDNRDKKMVGTSKFIFDLEDVDLHNKKIMIDSIYLYQPLVYFEAYDSTSNIAEFINRVIPQEDTLQQGGVEYETVAYQTDLQGDSLAKDTTQQFYICINSMQIEKGRVELADHSHERSFEYQMSDINILADSITTETSWMDIDISMNLSDRGKMVSEILVDLSNPQEMTLDFTISSLMLEDFDVYCREATGFPLMYGDMYLKSHTDVRNDTIKSQNNIIIHNMKFGRREKPIGPPIKFAMFLLKDKDKVIKIDMPMEGPVGESATDIGGMIWDTFSQLLVKVASTPFKFIGSVVNVFDVDLKRIKYEYMDTTFTDKKERQLNTLLKVEDLDEEVKIDLVYYKDSLLERQEIAKYLVGLKYGGKRGKRDYRKNEERFRKYVEKQLKTDTLSLEEACLLLADRNMVDSVSALYDSARFNSLRKYLISQRDTTDIKLYRSRDQAPGNEDKKPRFEVKLGLKDDFMEDKYIDKDED